MSIAFPGRARIDPTAPEALGICDRCGFQYSLLDLKPQVQWAGTRLINTGKLVCDTCNDVPSEFLRTIRLPADPPPVYNTRVENFALDEKNYYYLKSIIGHKMFEAQSSMSCALTLVKATPEIDAAFSGVSVMGADLTRTVHLEPAFSGVSVMDATLAGNIEIDAAFSGVASMAAALSRRANLEAAVTGVSVMTGIITVTTPLSINDLGTWAFNNAGGVSQGAGPFTSGSFTPRDNSLLTVFVTASPAPSAANEPAFVLTDSLGGTWVKAEGVAIPWAPDTSNGWGVVQAWRRTIATGVPMTLTVTHTGVTVHAMRINAVDFRGYNTGTPIGATGDVSTTSGTPAITLSAAPLASSIVIGSVMFITADGAGSGSVAPGAGFTELREDYTTDSFCKSEIEYRTGTTSPTVDWTITGGAGSPFNVRGGVAIEIRQA